MTTPPARPALWRTLLVVAASVTGVPAALFTAFFAEVTWTGCFIACSTPDHATGALLWLLALALLAVGPALGWWLLRSKWAAVLAGGAGLLGALAVVGVLTQS